MAPDKSTENSGKLMKIAIDKIRSRSLNCNQLNDEAYKGLIEDIKRNGMRYPILVRQIGPDGYEIVDGEHRWRAAKELGWREIECQVVEMSEEEADIANFTLNPERQRNPAIVAQIFNGLKMKGLAQESIVKKYGITQARVSQYLEMLTYPEEIQCLIISRLIGSEHARKIMSMLDDRELQIQVANKVVEEALSVRETKLAIKAILDEKRKKAKRVSRRGEALSVLDFAFLRGTHKFQECRKKDEDGVCVARWWLEEPVDLKEFTWFEVVEFEDMWYAKASTKLCAFCEKFTRGIDEAFERRTIALTSVVSLIGSVRKEECIHQIEGRCEEWECFRPMCYDYGQFDEDYFGYLSNNYCAVLCYDI